MKKSIYIYIFGAVCKENLTMLEQGLLFTNILNTKWTLKYNLVGCTLFFYNVNTTSKTKIKH